MFHTDRVIVVEGKYDKIRLDALVDAVIITTDGFGIFKDREKQRLIKKLARERGLLVLTDSDAAGFKIRNFLKNIVPEDSVLHAYIPDISGKEKRKDSASKEGKLGVEGMDTDVLTEALGRSGLFTEKAKKEQKRYITVSDLFEAGLNGGENSSEKRRALLRSLGLPERLTGKNFLDMLNTFMTYEEFLEFTS